MKELKDQEIKLFGKKIGLPENGKMFPVVVSGEDPVACECVSACDVVTSNETSIASGRDRCLEDEKLSTGAKHEADEEIDYHKQQVINDHITGEISEAKSKEKDQNQMKEGSGDSKTSSESDNNPKTPSIDEGIPTLKSSATENDQNDATSSQQQPPKKPDKIIPCPRCNSMDTKFCYYNNYNVNQPRHFCKSCQRYWTAGGTTRNVPVGAGRRKNKSSALHYHNIMISQALRGTTIDHPNGYNRPTFNTNGTVLSFGPDMSLHEPTASMLNLGEKNAPNGIRNVFYKLERENSTRKGGENGDCCSSGSSVTTSNSMVEGGTSAPHEAVAQNINGLQSPYLSGVPWPFAWNAAVPVPAICPPGFPLQFCPAPYWNCNVLGPWSVPWLTPPSPTAHQQGSGYAPNSFLGKRSRDGDLLKPNNPDGKDPAEQTKSERSILVPKTLRIDDPEEAAKSSIWSTLGIKYDSVSRRGLFKALQPNSNEKVRASNTSSMLHANPAALSRSVSFQERVSSSL